MKRIFTAIDISDEARAKTADYIKNLREEFAQIRVGWERTEKLHLTLKFFGDVDEEQLTKLTVAVEETAKQLSDFRLQITETGVFPSKRNARVLWLGVRDEKGILQKLNEILENECEKKGFVREKRNFKAHLTIARLREPHSSKELVERHLINKFYSDQFQVSKIAIYESHLQKTGSIYEKIKNAELKIQNQ
jgi:2'-5' RNA ligase